MERRKVVVIGLDAATLDLVRPLAEGGRLPHLARFLAQGASGELHSTIPASSPAAWSTFITGMNPGKHGVLDFVQFYPDSYTPRLVDATCRNGPAFWEIAGSQGVNGGIINVPVTYPPRPYNGFLVSGMLPPWVSRRMVHPADAYGALLAASPNYAVEVVARPGQSPEKFLKRALAGVRARLDGALGLYRRYKPSLFCVVFVAADRVCHYFWHYFESAQAGRALTATEVALAQAIPLVYQELDRAVGALMAEAGEDDTDFLVVSDHGSGPVRRRVNLRKVFADAGLLAEVRHSAAGRLSRRVVLALGRTTPVWLQNRLKWSSGILAGRAARLLSTSSPDPAHSAVYQAGRLAAVFVNLKGRQPQGIVEPGPEYEAVRDEAIRALSELTDPSTGKRVARKVRRREEVWSGPCVTRLPDVILEQGDAIYDFRRVNDDWRDEVFQDVPEPSAKHLALSGGHSSEGLLLAMGPHIRPGPLHGACIADVPATILALLDCELTGDLDGRVLCEMLTAGVKGRQGRTTGSL